ncbi:spore gernimation protein KB [Clostridium botulinum]|uniref:Spore gernimation protein KB n=1 Tax=Clostridium botulinum C/D str. DC5 TaxID=1443128 RepID=A0A0A0IP47_CLOBO|nr:endospore germination permease [Clostridium botulinum]KGN01241.1 spore gernimation protein KB [Clostridium botulinum C/D str. DC5]KOC53984.1 spore gernimation protein KB [Clostridium botulinum]KOC57845.1 spore gernimation protein KB [Clostridium botulinum]MCD3232881.1 endospore germination permease [Clostridium botulinum D/C]MCD3238741.1 endospore germination permease [Clostridium botulinum D/C]
MDKESISAKQLQFFIFTFGLGSHLLFNLGAGAGKQVWLASILSMIFSLPIVYVYGKIMSFYPEKNFYDILGMTFGKITGKILIMVFIFHTFLLGSYVIRDFSDFIKLTVLFDTPIVVPMICIGVLSVWILKAGIEVLSAWCHFFIRIILVIIPIVVILLLPQMNSEKVLPLFDGNTKEILKEAVKFVMFPMTEVIIFLNVFNYVKPKANIQAIFIKPIILGGILYAILIVINIMILGANAYSEFYYPGYEAIKRLNLGGEFQRLEILVSGAFTIIQFTEINYCLLGVSKGIEKLFSLNDYRDILVPIVILMINFSYIIFGNPMNSIDFSKNYWPIYALVPQLILPIIILIVILIKRRNNSLKESEN